MTDIQGTNLAAGITPFTTEDPYATHYALYGHGGWREVSTLSERDAIPSERRSIGMVVYVAATDTAYQLKTDGWVTLETSGGSTTSSYTELTDKPSIGGVTLTGDKTLTELGIQAAGDYATTEEVANTYATKESLQNYLTFMVLEETE